MNKKLSIFYFFTKLKQDKEFIRTICTDNSVRTTGQRPVLLGLTDTTKIKKLYGLSR